MFYLETNQPHYFVFPALAVGLDDEFWIGIGWLNFEIGWRNGDGGERISTPPQHNANNF